jgi:hypothetical protein
MSIVIGPLTLTAQYGVAGVTFGASTDTALALVSFWVPGPPSPLEISHRPGATRIDFKRCTLRIVRRPEKSC